MLSLHLVLLVFIAIVKVGKMLYVQALFAFEWKQLRLHRLLWCKCALHTEVDGVEFVESSVDLHNLILVWK